MFPLTRPTHCQPPDPSLFISKKKKKKKYSARPYKIFASVIFLWKFVEIVMWAQDDQITFFLAVADLPHVYVELVLLFLHRSFDNKFEDIIKSFLHLHVFAVQS